MLYIAADHGGYQLKKYLIRYLKNQFKIKAVDLGPNKYDEFDDFPDYALLLAQKMTKNKKNLGILVCGSGQGMCMAANKVKGVRAIVGYSIDSAEWGRRHHDANILCLAGKILSNEHAVAILKKFLETEPENEEKYIRRRNKLNILE